MKKMKLGTSRGYTEAGAGGLLLGIVVFIAVLLFGYLILHTAARMTDEMGFTHILTTDKPGKNDSGNKPVDAEQLKGSGIGSPGD